MKVKINENEELTTSLDTDEGKVNVTYTTTDGVTVLVATSENGEQITDEEALEAIKEWITNNAEAAEVEEIEEVPTEEEEVVVEEPVIESVEVSAEAQELEDEYLAGRLPRTKHSTITKLLNAGNSWDEIARKLEYIYAGELGEAVVAKKVVTDESPANVLKKVYGGNSLTPALKNKIKSLLDAGKTWKEIAEEVGWNSDTHQEYAYHMENKKIDIEKTVNEALASQSKTYVAEAVSKLLAESFNVGDKVAVIDYDSNNAGYVGAGVFKGYTNPESGFAKVETANGAVITVLASLLLRA